MSTPHDYRRPDGFPELRSRGNSRHYIEPDYVASDADDQLPLLSTIGRGPRGHSVLVGSVTDDGDEFSYTLIDEEGKVLYQTPDLSAGTISVSSMPEEPVAGDKVQMLVTVSRGSMTKRYSVAIPSGATGSRVYVVQGNLQYGGEGHAYQTQVSRLMVYGIPQPSGWESWPEPRVNDIAFFRADGMLCIGTIETVQDGMVTFTSQTTIDPLSHLSIGANGNWVIDNVDTGVQARGERGEQGPQGVPGPVGPQGPPDGLPARMSVGTVDEGAAPAFSVRLVDETTNTYAVDVTLPRGADGKSINVNGGVYKVSDLPPFDDTPVNDAFIVNDYEESGDYRYDLYIRGREPVIAEDGGPWTVVEDWQGVHGYSMRVLVGHEISPDAPISIAKDQASVAFTPSSDILDGDIAYDGHSLGVIGSAKDDSGYYTVTYVASVMVSWDDISGKPDDLVHDADLQEAIDAEKSAREQADQSLQSKIDAEKSAREQADQSIQASVSSLNTALEAEESAREAAVSAEAQARSEADQALDDAIAALPTGTDVDGKISAALAAEAAEREKQDNLLQDGIDGKLQASDLVAGTNVTLDTTSQPGRVVISATAATYDVATDSTDGLMSSEDKAKLDGLPSSIAVPSVDIVKVTSHSTSYTKDTLEVVCDSTGKVTAMYFVTA